MRSPRGLERERCNFHVTEIIFRAFVCHDKNDVREVVWAHHVTISLLRGVQTTRRQQLCEALLPIVVAFSRDIFSARAEGRVGNKRVRPLLVPEKKMRNGITYDVAPLQYLIQ